METTQAAGSNEPAASPKMPDEKARAKMLKSIKNARDSALALGWLNAGIGVLLLFFGGKLGGTAFSYPGALFLVALGGVIVYFGKRVPKEFTKDTSAALGHLLICCWVVVVLALFSGSAPGILFLLLLYYTYSAKAQAQKFLKSETIKENSTAAKHLN